METKLFCEQICVRCVSTEANLLRGDRLDSSSPLLPSWKNACSLKFVSCCWWIIRLLRAMPDSEMEVRPLRSPESPPTLELALFIMAAIEKFVILDSEDVGLFGCILELSLDLGRNKNGLLSPDEIFFGEFWGYGGEDDDWSSLFCLAGKVKILGDIMQDCISRFYWPYMDALAEYRQIIPVCTALLHIFSESEINWNTEKLFWETFHLRYVTIL